MKKILILISFFLLFSCTQQQEKQIITVNKHSLIDSLDCMYCTLELPYLIDENSVEFHIHYIEEGEIKVYKDTLVEFWLIYPSKETEKIKGCFVFPKVKNIEAFDIHFNTLKNE